MSFCPFMSMPMVTILKRYKAFIKDKQSTGPDELCEVAQSCSTLGDPVDCSLPGFSVHRILLWQEYWSGLPFPSPGDLPDPGIEPRSPTLEADALTSEPPGFSLFLDYFVVVKKSESDTYMLT